MSADKPVQANNVPTPQPQQRIPHEQIAARAQQLWRERNCPAGSDDAIWLEAESQLEAEAEARPVAGTPSRPYTNEPGQPLRSRTKVQDPSESAVQPRTATPPKKNPKQVRDQ